MRLSQEQCRERVAVARHAVLASVTPDGAPHAVPVVFAPDGDRLVTAVDGKPKSTLHLQRLRNLRARPRAALLVEHYDEDWSRLWWVRVDARAWVLDAGDRQSASGLARLAERYPQYLGLDLVGPLIVLEPVRWTGWAWSGR